MKLRKEIRMAITINLYYRLFGNRTQGDLLRKWFKVVLSMIFVQVGNLRYEYFFLWKIRRQCFD